MKLVTPRLGMGTWKLCGGWERDERKRTEAIAALSFGLSLGYRIVDTAEVYADGLAEEVVGEAIRTVERSHVYIITKVRKENLAYDNVRRALEGSLKRLNTSYVDLYLIHAPSETVALAETFRALDQLVHEGLVKEIGVSNFPVSLLEEAVKIAKHPIAAHQCEYSVVNRAAEKDTIPFSRLHQIDTIAYRPLGKGARFPEAVYEIAQEQNVTPAQVALRWLTAQGVYAIPKASREEHLKENWYSQRILLSEEEIERIRA